MPKFVERREVNRRRGSAVTCGFHPRGGADDDPNLACVTVGGRNMNGDELLADYKRAGWIIERATCFGDRVLVFLRHGKFRSTQDDL